MSTSLKGVSSMKLRRDLNVTRKTAWFLAHRIREHWIDSKAKFNGPVEVDETYVGGKCRNIRNSKRKQPTGRGPVSNTAVEGAKDRAIKQGAAKAVRSTDKMRLCAAL